MANAIPQGPASGDFDGWELQLIGLRVEDFLRTRPGARFDADDLRQEALIHWWLQRDRYRPERRASTATYLRRVVDAKLLDIERTEQARKRGGGSRPLSLDAPIAEDSDATLGDVVPGRERTRDVALQRDFHAAAVQLTGRQRKLLVEKARGLSMAEIASVLNVSRDTLYEDLKVVGAVFRDAGLEDYVR